jgi:hypothetical protein
MDRDPPRRSRWPFACAGFTSAVVILATLVPVIAAEKTATQNFTGKVVPLAGILEKFGSRLDPDVANQWLALATDDGKIYPLIKDDGSRLFFSDRQLLNRPMRITGRLFKDTHLLQVLAVNSIKNGALYEVYYWCETCSIRRGEKLKRCECCGGPLELREEPVKK